MSLKMKAGEFFRVIGEAAAISKVALVKYDNENDEILRDEAVR